MRNSFQRQQFHNNKLRPVVPEICTALGIQKHFVLAALLVSSDWMWWFLCWRSIHGRGLVDRKGRRRRRREGLGCVGWGGVELTGVGVGIWGWATVEHPPRYCLLCQAESVFRSLSSKKPKLICQPQQTLSISGGHGGPTPTHCRCLPFHTGMEILKARIK